MNTNIKSLLILILMTLFISYLSAQDDDTKSDAGTEFSPKEIKADKNFDGEIDQMADFHQATPVIRLGLGDK